MKYFFLTLLTFSSYFLQAQNPSIHLNTKNLPLEEVFNQIEQQNDYLFSYKNEDIKNITITVQADGIKIDAFLRQIFKPHQLDFEIVNDKYILVRKKQVQEEEIPLTLLKGQIIDSLTQQPLTGANVYLKKAQKGTYTDEKGSFQFEAKVENNDSLVVSYVGYQTLIFPATAFTNGKTPIVALPFFNFGANFIIVKDYLTDGIDLTQNGAVTKLKPNKIGAMPGQVEPDVLSSIQFLPGISNPDEKASDIYIRGGTPDQNLMMWEGIPIYHAAHYFERISAFNPFIIDEAEIYRSGFEAKYGGRISGLVNLKSADASVSESQFGAGTNFTHAYFYGKVAFVPQKTSAVFSIRRSIRDIWSSPSFDSLTLHNLEDIVQTRADLVDLPKHIKLVNDFNFLDANAKISHQLSAKDELSAAWFFGLNDFNNHWIDTKKDLDQLDKLDLTNQGMSLNWNRQWNKHFSSKISAIRSHFFYDYAYNVQDGNAPKPASVGKKRSKILEYQLHWDNTWIIRNKQKINAGYQYVDYDIGYEIKEERDNRNPANKETEYNKNLHVLYSTFSTNTKKPFNADIGLRMNYYSGFEKIYFEPRLRAGYRLSDTWSVHANAGQYYQFLSRLIEFDVNKESLRVPIWILSGEENIPVLRSQQLQLGLIFNKKGWVLDLQTYLKKVSGLTSFSIGFDIIDNRAFDIGEADISGIDILLKKRWNNYRTWFSYSLNKVTYHFPLLEEKSFPAFHDQRHFLQWANLLSVKNFEFSLGLKVASGRPYTFSDSYEEIPSPMMGGGSKFQLIIDEVNGLRLPVSSRLDASVLYHFFPKQRDKWKGIVGVSLYNILNQSSWLSRRYELMREVNGDAFISENNTRVLGITPNVVLRVEW